MTPSYSIAEAIPLNDNMSIYLNNAIYMYQIRRIQTIDVTSYITHVLIH